MEEWVNRTNKTDNGKTTTKVLADAQSKKNKHKNVFALWIGQIWYLSCIQ